MENSYYNWFTKLIGILVDLFFMFIPAAVLYVFTSLFSGLLRYGLFVLMIIIYLLVIHFGKDRIRILLDHLLDRVASIDEKKMAWIIALAMIVLRLIYTLFFDFDATVDGDIGLYSQIADKIIANGSLRSSAISHLFAVAIHFIPFKLLHIPVRHGMFLPFFFGTLINFYSFKKIIGKDKAFLAILAYLLMPSSILYSFCPTHEVFFYFYLSSFLFCLNHFLAEDKTRRILIDAALCTLLAILCCFINPVGYIIYVILLLIIVLSKVAVRKKALIAIILVLAAGGSSLLDKVLEVNEYKTSTNTYTILIHGANPESLGEQVDGYPHDQTRKYMKEHGLEDNKENYLIAMKAVLLGLYKHLLTHPVTLFKLIVHKFYLLWSGNHYPIEMAKIYGDMNDIVYYGFLTVSAMIYLFMATLKNVFRGRHDDKIFVSNYKLALLGVFAVTMLSIVVNKYGVYVTPYLYLISLYETELKQ